MNKKLLKTIIKDIDKVKKMACSLEAAATSFKITLEYGSYDDLDKYMSELAKVYPVWRYQVEVLRGIYITINFN